MACDNLACKTQFLVSCFPVSYSSQGLLAVPPPVLRSTSRTGNVIDRMATFNSIPFCIPISLFSLMTFAATHQTHLTIPEFSFILLEKAD